MAALDPDSAWSLHPQVAVRPESFGALLYHFGTRKLSFLKSRRLLEVVEGLSGAASADAALERAGVTSAERPAYLAALGALVDSQMIVERAA